jgi:hypothetical protein
MVSPQIEIKIFKLSCPQQLQKEVGKLALKSGSVDEILPLVFITMK